MNVELNITLQCNLACNNCNRMCHVYRDRTEHMSVDQIRKFVQQAREAGGVNTIKVLGGEPLLNPDFIEIYNVLVEACKEGVIKFMKVDTNHTIPFPEVERYPFVRWMGKSSVKKRHIPFLTAPKDLGYITVAQPRCPAIRRCGISLDKYGYLPCSPAIMLARLFGHESLYRREFPREIWGLDDLCHYCTFSMPIEWQRKYANIPILEHTKEDKEPSPIFKEAMEKFKHEEFYKTQKEF